MRTAKLKDSVIVRVGSNKTGYWKVNILKEYIYVESRREDA